MQLRDNKEPDIKARWRRSNREAGTDRLSMGNKRVERHSTDMMAKASDRPPGARIGGHLLGDGMASAGSKFESANSSGDRAGGVPEDPVQVAARLEWVRRYFGLTQKEFAQSIEVLPTTYSNWRRCSQNLSLDGAKRIRQRYGISLDFLFFGEAHNLPAQIRAAWDARADA
ncbi:MAG: helix-turn-helix transcriptional regulator [Alphaproteobacteria bacterium]|nr:helix-turn-helix transcriptional regulator [Alphaproteobacteria bacterium]MCB9930935.1 helix-turn-helix transcriptional regulator [Alphaproteobacteria bacterium]